ncbi:MAG: family 10 glycosylhydrolase [Flavobacteriales bacterium]|nr:family 10 glycosylhydrolase [Flavobacteriales bacterium]
MKSQLKYILLGLFILVGCKDKPEPVFKTQINIEVQEPIIKNWMWVRNDKKSTDKELVDKFQKLVDHHISGVLIAGDHERMSKAAKSVGLETHIWIWTLNRGDQEIMDHHPDWYSINRNGESCHDHPPYVGYYRWLCPTKQPVRAFLKDQIKELVAKDYIDGIHLDYVRYCDVILPSALWEKYNLVQDHEMPAFDYCYCDDCRSHFMSTNYAGKRFEDPLIAKDPSLNKDWVQFRYDMVTEVVNELSAVCHEAGKPISAAVFPTPSIAKKLVRQDWVNWDLDMVFPMVYHAFYEENTDWVKTATLEGVEALAGKFPLYSGMYMPDIKTANQLDSVVRNTLSAKANGYSILGTLSDEQWAVLKKH